jgi:DNA-binding NarL/FixJ family response regulator
VGADSFLIVEDEIGETFARILRFYGSTVVAPSLIAARRALEKQTFAAIMLDVRLPDGNALDLLAEIRTSAGPHANVPVLVLTGHSEERWANAAFDLRAHYVEKPVTRARFEQFLRETVPRFRIQTAVDAWRKDYELTQTECSVLHEHALGVPPDVIASCRGCSPRTLQKHVENLLRKTGDDRLSAAANRLLREALGS